MKRNFQLTTINGRLPPLKKRVIIKREPVRAAYRAYPMSRVPAASRGYTPNTVEKKLYDVAPGTVAVSTTGSFTLLCVPQLGTDMMARIGRKIVMKSVYIRGRINTDGADNLNLTQVSCQHVRMVIFVDFQPNGNAPATTDLLTTASPAAHLNINNRDRFKVLVDKEWVLDPWVYTTTATQAIITGANQVKLIRKYKKLNQEVIFNGVNGGTISDIVTGALYVFFIGDKALGTGTDAAATVSTRVRFVDP